MKIQLNLLFLLSYTLIVFNTSAQNIPLVYDLENTGASFDKPVLPTFAELPTIGPLPDPFMWSATDPSGWTDSTTARSTQFSDWSKRRAEIAWELQNYEIGIKPVVPRDSVTASYSEGKLSVVVRNNGQTCTITSNFTLPEGTGPFPAIIGMNSPNGSLPSSIFTDRNIARIPFSHDQVSAYGNPSAADPFFKLYPEQNVDNTGQYAAWSWGVSRIIDGLEICAANGTLPIDVKHLAVTGCSYAGKMALWAGALDERIALTLPQESGGGGIPAWRVSETIGAVEKLGATDNKWFKNDMWSFAGNNTAKLPHDHHELIAMIAPRAMLTFGNGIAWLADPSGYVSLMAAREVYKQFGIEDRIGWTMETTHAHCGLPAEQEPELIAFVEKFLLGDSTINTTVMKSNYTTLDHQRWINWWGTNKPKFPMLADSLYEKINIEAERLISEGHGTNFNIVKNTEASNNYYIVVKQELAQNLSAASTDPLFLISATFTTKFNEAYNIFGRLNCPSADDDSFWLKIDNGDYTMLNGLGTGGVWNWTSLSSGMLTPGEHTITICPRENGAMLDKLYITNYPYAPEAADKGGVDDLIIGWEAPVEPNGIGSMPSADGYELGECYPNPVNEKTNISFQIPNKAYVSLKVFNTIGLEIEEIAGKEYDPGQHTIVFDSRNYPQGIYFYTLKVNKFVSSRKMIVQTN
ncbi:MAG: T9SS type A sorting domain-containing protein [Prolixibacteraceae bacterium]